MASFAASVLLTTRNRGGGGRGSVFALRRLLFSSRGRGGTTPPFPFRSLLCWTEIFHPGLLRLHWGVRTGNSSPTRFIGVREICHSDRLELKLAARALVRCRGDARIGRSNPLRKQTGARNSRTRPLGPGWRSN